MPRPVATEIIEMDSAAAGHIVRHDPARVLREVAAKRRIIDECENTINYQDHGWSLAHPVLRLIALSYADHKDYQEGWKP